VSGALQHDVADLGPAPLGRERIEWADREMLAGVIGGTEETTTGVVRLRALEAEEIAALKLATLGVGIDALTDEQVRYPASWERGT
jgi:S-adenosylhomocysteine hydrolase